MNGRKLSVLTAIAAILALGEFGSAVIIGLGEDGPDRSGWLFAGVTVQARLPALTAPAALRTVAAGGATFGPGVASRLVARTPARLPAR